MSLTVLSDVIAPNSIWAAGARGKQMRVNSRGQNQGGYRQVNVMQSVTLRQYEFGTVPIQEDGADEDARRQAWQDLEGLHEVTEAGGYGFLLLDPKDCTANHAAGKVTLINAGAHTYQLIKRYTSVGSTRTKDRKITRPRVAGFVLRINGAPTNDFTLDKDTGVITIPSDPTAANVTWSGTFYIPVHFEQDDLDWDLLIAGPVGTRFVAAPTVVLTEVRE